MLLLAAFRIEAAEQARIALVIGNAAYPDAPLANPVNDAHLIAASLKQARFRVTEYGNLDLDHLRKALQTFGDQLAAAGKEEAAFVYYSGHGVQAEGHNYLIPIGASIHKEADLELQALDASVVLRQMEGAGAAINILVLDACRNNPFQRTTRTLGKGLARMDTGRGSFYLAYATAPDTEAQDGKGANSPYAKALASALLLPGIPIEGVFKRVRAQVLSETGNQQQPWESSSLLADFYLNPAPAPPPAAPQPLAVVSSQHPPAPAPTSPAHASQSTFRDCPDCPEMVVIPPGRFMMGSPPSELGRSGDEGPVHTVTIGYSFAVGKYPVTRGEWRQFVKATSHSMAKCALGGNWENPGFTQDDSHPVVCITWEDATAYTAWLSQKTRHHYRLLSEAEYEYVNRAGSTSRYFWGNSESDLCRYQNGGATSICKYEYTDTSPVGHFLPNGFGLYDTAGNVRAWTQDCYHKTYDGAPMDGSAWESGDCQDRVVRGSSWGYSSTPMWFRSANRFQDNINYIYDVGARLARDDR
jgi:formylglycine-generating enzyme required for sulfatase activity